MAPTEINSRSLGRSRRLPRSRSVTFPLPEEVAEPIHSERPTPGSDSTAWLERRRCQRRLSRGPTVASRRRYRRSRTLRRGTDGLDIGRRDGPRCPKESSTRSPRCFPVVLPLPPYPGIPRAASQGSKWDAARTQSSVSSLVASLAFPSARQRHQPGGISSFDDLLPALWFD
jgi:hypothetical protein